MPWKCVCGATFNAALVIGSVCGACGERIVGAECVDYVASIYVVTETKPVTPLALRGIQPMPCPGVLADDLMHAYLSGPECNTPPAPQRFWRMMEYVQEAVYRGVRGKFQAMQCDARGVFDPPWHMQDLPWTQLRPTRAEAEADGVASGLPRWPGEGGER